MTNENTMELGLIVKDAKVVVSSRMVAQVFEKEHKHVLRDIETLGCSETFIRSNFGPVEYRDAKGEMRPEILLTRDGFTLLAMGYKGERAMRFKEAYINAFNMMEQKLKDEERFYIPQNYGDALALASKLEVERAALAAKVEQDAPKVKTFDAHYPDGKLTSITDFARTLDGVNTMLIKKSLTVLGYLYQTPNVGKYRVYAAYRGIDNLFVEKHNPAYDVYTIYLTNKGAQHVTKLANEGKLAMLKRNVA